MKNFLIEYTAYDKSGNKIKSGTMRAKKKETEFSAKAGFENFLIKKHKNFGRLVIHSCHEENSLSSIFGDLFGQNPFS